MAGLYIHVPFCKTKCHYCDFYKTTDVGLKKLYLDALIIEIENNAHLLSEYGVRTIYFGGGTPSLLQRNDFELIFDALKLYIDFRFIEEITVEVNPDDFTEDYAFSLKQLPINRLSFGLQSVYDDLLQMMGRRHSAQQAIDAIRLAWSVGFSNITVDLIYGLPGLDVDRWRSSVKAVAQLPIKHVSAYHLTYEKDTPFHRDLKSGRKKEIDDELSLLQYNILCEELSLQGFDGYEISNFSKFGFESKHNSLYWSGEEYFGFGPSAHSYYQGARKWNYASLNKYSKHLSLGEVYFDAELLSERDRYNECIMLGLRQKKGFELSRLSLIGDGFTEIFDRTSKRFFLNSDLIVENGFCKVSDKSRFITDYIIQELFVIE